jgi:hypothetical protein
MSTNLMASNKRNLFSHNSGGQKFKIKVYKILVEEPILSQLLGAASSSCCFLAYGFISPVSDSVFTCLLIVCMSSPSSSYKDTCLKPSMISS